METNLNEVEKNLILNLLSKRIKSLDVLIKSDESLGHVSDLRKNLRVTCLSAYRKIFDCYVD